MVILLLDLEGNISLVEMVVNRMERLDENVRLCLCNEDFLLAEAKERLEGMLAVVSTSIMYLLGTTCIFSIRLVLERGTNPSAKLALKIETY